MVWAFHNTYLTVFSYANVCWNFVILQPVDRAYIMLCWILKRIWSRLSQLSQPDIQSVSVVRLTPRIEILDWPKCFQIMIWSAVCRMFTGFNDLWQKCKGRGSYGRMFDLPAIVPRNFTMSLWHWLLTSGLKRVDVSHLTRSSWVPQPSWGNRSAGWDTKCLIRKTLSWFVAGTRTFGASVVSIPAETDQFNTSVNLMVAPGIWNKNDWERLNKANCIYLLLLFFEVIYICFL